MKNIFSKMPSFVWVILLPVALVLFIASIIGTFYVLAHVEGVASIVLLIIAYCVLKVTYSRSETKDRLNSFITAAGITYFALMGMAIDQPGNYLYNKPLEYFFCPENTHLQRTVDVSHPLPGRTDMTQEFICFTDSNEPVKQVGMFEIIGTRFLEYVLIGYLLLYIVKFQYKKA